MRLLVVLVSVAATAWGKPQPQLGSLVSSAVNTAANTFRNAFIVRSDDDRDPNGSYRYSVETSDGFQKEETGQVISKGTDQESLAVTGSYSYVGDDGKTYEVKYTADEDGFRPEGAHIPPAADVKRPKVGVPSAAIASLAG